MAFNLGNYSVRELLFGVAQNFDGDLLYSLDQLTNAQIEITSDPTEVTDKNGNVIRSIYTNKTGTFTATSALASPVLLNAQSGSPAEYASADNKIEMPKIVTVAAGATYDASDAKEGTIHVMGIYNNGANGTALTQGTSAVVDKTFAFDTATNKITVPAAGDDAPTQYLIKYDRDVESGLKLSNYADKFPDTVRLTLYAAIMDPCADRAKAGYIYIPSFQPDPSVTISFDSENQEVDFNGNLNIDFCGTEKVLYIIYFPDEDAIVTGTAA